MKIHISNVYGVSKNSGVYELQNYIARLGRDLGFLELGIYKYPVESDTYEELGRRLDGIIASIENGDVILLQLPTGNGIEFEKRLIAKIRGYYNSKIILMIHDVSVYETFEVFGGVEKIICNNQRNLNEALKKGAYAPIRECCVFSTTNELLSKENLIGAVIIPDEAELANYPKDDDLIHVGFGLHDKTGNYSVLVGTVIQSVMMNTTAKVCFHVFHDETLSHENRIKLMQTAYKFDAYIDFNKVDVSEFTSDNKWVAYYTVGAMFRLVMPRVLSDLNKLIYLDADLLFNRDIRELWAIDLSNYSIAAIKDVIFDNGIIMPNFVRDGIVPKDRYFNSGLLVMNLEKIREKGDLVDLAMDFLKKNPDSALPDQDALNYYFNSTALLLDADWNAFTQYESKKTSLLRENVVYHFMGQPTINYFKPTDFEKLFFSVKEKTAWGYSDLERDVFKGYALLSDKINNLQTFMFRKDPYKKIFIGENTNAMQNLIKLVGAGPRDYYIRKNVGDIPKSKIKKLKDITKEKRGEYIIFILPDAEKGEALKYIRDIGLIEYEDFFVIPKMLVGGQGGYWG